MFQALRIGGMNVFPNITFRHAIRETGSCVECCRITCIIMKMHSAILISIVLCVGDVKVSRSYLLCVLQRNRLFDRLYIIT